MMPTNSPPPRYRDTESPVRTAVFDRRCVRIAVFDHRPVVAEGLADLLADDPRIEVIGATTHPVEMARMVTEAAVQVAVIGDENPAHGPPRSTVDAVTSAASTAGRPVGLVIIVRADRHAAYHETWPHQHDFVVTTASRGELCDAVITADPDDGRLPRPRRIRGVPAAPPPAAPQVGAALTLRQRQVLDGIWRGLSTREIAAELGITTNTARTHAQNVLTTLGVRSRLQAAALAADVLRTDSSEDAP